jgi:hypothetical protein
MAPRRRGAKARESHLALPRSGTRRARDRLCKQGKHGIRQSARSPQIRKGVMGLFWKDIKTMDDLLLHGLKDIYYAEL